MSHVDSEQTERDNEQTEKQIAKLLTVIDDIISNQQVETASCPATLYEAMAKLANYFGLRIEITDERLEKQTVELLAIIYNAIDWGKMRTSKNPHDIFNHRVRAASRRATLYEAVSKLANYFGLQSLPAEALELIQELRPHEREVLNKLYTEHIPMSMLAIMRAKEMRDERKRAKKSKQEETELIPSNLEEVLSDG